MMLSTLLTNTKKKILPFGSSETGNVALLFAVLSVPVISVVGLAVDLGQAYRYASSTQNALDSAVLAAGRAAQTNSGERFAAAQSAATNFFNASKPTGPVSSTLALAVDSTNTNFTLIATSWVKTPFLNVLSRMFSSSPPAGAPASCDTAFACLKITRTGTASIGSGGNGGSNVEVSLMLDVTGSMDGSKLDTLKSAASSLVDTIVWTDQSKYTSRMAIAPFAEHVNVGTYYTAVTNRNLSSGRDPCVVDRTGTYASTDAAPGSNTWIPRFNTSACNPNVPILPLTSNKTTLKSTINSLTANGNTAGALGTDWAWYLISPKWASVWGTSSAPGSYSDLSALNSNGAPVLKKFAVLMTDGDYNFMSGAIESQSVVNSAALSTCDGMKSVGITIYTVGFQLSSPVVKDMLTNCASGSDKFYDATSESALIAAFGDIALKIATVRLTN